MSSISTSSSSAHGNDGRASAVSHTQLTRSAFVALSLIVVIIGAALFSPVIAFLAVGAGAGYSLSGSV